MDAETRQERQILKEFHNQSTLNFSKIIIQMNVSTAKAFAFVSLPWFSHCTEACFGSPQSYAGNPELPPTLAYNSSLQH